MRFQCDNWGALAIAAMGFSHPHHTTCWYRAQLRSFTMKTTTSILNWRKSSNKFSAAASKPWIKVSLLIGICFRRLVALQSHNRPATGHKQWNSLVIVLFEIDALDLFVISVALGCLAYMSLTVINSCESQWCIIQTVHLHRLSKIDDAGSGFDQDYPTIQTRTTQVFLGTSGPCGSHGRSSVSPRSLELHSENPGNDGTAILTMILVVALATGWQRNMQIHSPPHDQAET